MTNSSGPAASRPAREAPDRARPDAARPDGARPDGARPGTGDPAEPSPDGAGPGAGDPDAARPDRARPERARPGAGDPDGVRPDRARPGAGDPDAGDPDGGRPDRARPDRARPGAGDPDAARPGEREPAVAELDWLAPFRVDIRLTLNVHRHGAHDPTFRADPSGAVWRTSLTPAGPGTLRLSARRDGGPGQRIRGLAWGPGAHWLIAQVPDLLGVLDTPEDFRPVHARLAELARRLPGLRIGRTDRVLEALIPAVLEQKVVGREAWLAWRRLVTWYGSPAPGPAPAGMRVMPSPAVWHAIPSYDWHRAGVEPARARTIAAAARRAGRLEAVSGLPGADADRVLQSLPGVGPWTAAEVRQRACGDTDAVSVGDYHLPTLVGWTLAGAPADDAGMLELLAPYAGHRYRVTRLIELAGQRPPRRGPRLSARDYTAF